MTMPNLLGVLSIVIVGGSLVTGCGESKTVPAKMLGSYVRTEPTMLGLARRTANLEITTTGMTARSAGMGVEMGVTPDGPRGRISESTASSVLFKSVACSSDTCKFVGADDRCDGTFTRDAAGDVTIIASGLCASGLAGKWLGSANAANLAPEGPAFH